MVSFFFTPIYMFILIFIVSFSTKRGTVATYSSAWSPMYTTSLSSIVNSVGRAARNSRELTRLYTYRLQHTALTSRPTIYILVVFWCFFFFFGESLLLITLNYNTLTDLVPSGFFVFTKSHAIFMTDSSNALLGEVIFFFILFFTTSAVAFLFNLKYAYTYNYTRATSVIDVTVAAIMLYLFSPYFLLLVLVLQALRAVRGSQASQTL